MKPHCIYSGTYVSIYIYVYIYIFIYIYKCKPMCSFKTACTYALLTRSRQGLPSSQLWDIGSYELLWALHDEFSDIPNKRAILHSILEINIQIYLARFAKKQFCVV